VGQERVADTMATIHDRLVAALSPRPGERWLDVGTGTGAVALRAARAGARVTGLDFAAPLIETASRLAAEEGLATDFHVGDAQALPCGVADGRSRRRARRVGRPFRAAALAWAAAGLLG
jgi:ubiquinone/menaquinone biosynthesis C-methylase UbiE